MLNRIQPLGRHYNSYELTKFRLSDDALEVIDDWIEWLLTGTLSRDGVLQLFRDGVANL